MKIFLLEDDETVAFGIKTYLEKDNYSVIVANSIGEAKKVFDYNYHFNLDGDLEDKISFGTNLRDLQYGVIEGRIRARDIYTYREAVQSIYGSLYFIGIFLGLLFIVATVLIIYYKQISEGYEDRQRFEMLQKVGMSREEVKKVIKSQVLLVFSLPLITAIIHTLVAFPIVAKILSGLSLTNTGLFLGITGGVILLFSLAYGIVYRWTAKVYYKIVE